MRILITGAGGFIGKHVASMLKNRGEVFLCGRDTCNMLDTAALSTLVNQLRPTHCLHLAWDTRGDYAESTENLAWLHAGMHFIRAFYAMGGQRFVGVGTCFEYTPGGTPLREADSPTAPLTRYGESKLLLGKFLASHANSTGRSWAWCRPFYLTGPWEAAHRLVPSACRALLQGKDFFTAAYDRELDYLDVRDAAGALATVLESDYCGTVNIGSGRGTRICDLLNLLAGMINTGATIRKKKDSTEKHPIIADISILQHEINFAPRFLMQETLTACINDIKGCTYELH